MFVYKAVGASTAGAVLAVPLFGQNKVILLYYKRKYLVRFSKFQFLTFENGKQSSCRFLPFYCDVMKHHMATT